MIATVRGRRALRAGADQEPRDRLDRLLRRGQADPLQPVAAQRREPLQRQREMRAALVRRDAHGFRRRSRCASSPASCGPIPSRAGYRAIPASSRRYAAGGGASGRARPTACRRCAPRCGFRRRAGPLRAAPRGCRRAAPRGCGGCRSTAPSAARRRRPASRRSSAPFETLPHQIVDRREKRGQRLAGAGRRGDQRMAAGLDRRPGLGLRGRRRAKLPSNHAATAGWNSDWKLAGGRGRKRGRSQRRVRAPRGRSGSGVSQHALWLPEDADKMKVSAPIYGAAPSLATPCPPRQSRGHAPGLA